MKRLELLGLWTMNTEETELIYWQLSGLFFSDYSQSAPIHFFVLSTGIDWVNSATVNLLKNGKRD